MQVQDVSTIYITTKAGFNMGWIAKIARSFTQLYYLYVSLADLVLNLIHSLLQLKTKKSMVSYTNIFKYMYMYIYEFPILITERV